MLAASLLAVFVYSYHQDAFPELSPGFTLKKSDVPLLAGKYAQRFGFDPEQYQTATTFRENTRTKYFLELEYGLGKLREDTERGINIWNWAVRYYLPGQEREMTLQLNTEGILTGFHEVIPETEVRPGLTETEARTVAESFLSDMVTQHPLEPLNLIETGFRERHGHGVHSFTWERRDWRWDKGRYHVHVSISGDRVSHFSEHLKVPDTWQRDFRKKRSENEIYQTIAESTSLLLLIGIVSMFIFMMVRHEVHWHGFPYLWIVPVALILLLAQFSNFPDILSNYNTRNEFGSYLFSRSLTIVYGVTIQIILFLLLAFMADAFWMKVFPGHTPIRALLSGKGLATRESMRAVPMGFLLALVTLAYVIAYYKFGRSAGLWAPSSIDQARVLTSYFPAVEALSVGISAAWREEFFFRVLGIVLIYRLTGSRWLAILVSAAAWGFLHSNYPQLPGYARGIELTLEGIALGWIAIRYGILTTLLSHSLYNTWLGAIIAWQTGSPLQMGMAVLVSIWPVALWFRGYWQTKRTGRELTTAELQIGTKPLVQQLQEYDAIINVNRPAGFPLRQVLALSVIAAAMILASDVPKTVLDELGKVELTHEKVRKRSDAVFQRETGLDPSDFRRLTIHQAYLANVDRDYILEYAEVDQAASKLAASLYEDYWKTSYFQFEQRNTYNVYLDRSGRRILVHRSVADSEPGARLEPAEAIELAEQYLRERFGLEPSAYRYLSHEMKNRAARNDYNVIFESMEWDLGESRLRWQITLLGDKLNGYKRILKIPDEYIRSKSAQGWRDAVQSLLTYAGILILGIGILLVNGMLIIRHHIPWRLVLTLSAFMPLVHILRQLNLLPEFFSVYNTTQTLTNFLTLKGLGIAGELLISFAYTAALIAGVLGLCKWVTGRDSRSVLFGDTPHEIWTRVIQGVWLGLIGLVLVWALEGFANTLLYRYISAEGLLETRQPLLQGYLPSLNILSQIVVTSINTALLNGLILLLVILLWEKHRQLLILLVLMLLIDVNLEWDTWIEAGAGLVYQMAKLSLLLWLYTRIFRFNPFAYILLFYFENLIYAATTMATKAWPAYALDVTVLWIALAAPLILGLAGFYLSRKLHASPVS